MSTTKLMGVVFFYLDPSPFFLPRTINLRIAVGSRPTAPCQCAQRTGAHTFIYNQLTRGKGGGGGKREREEEEKKEKKKEKKEEQEQEQEEKVEEELRLRGEGETERWLSEN